MVASTMLTQKKHKSHHTSILKTAPPLTAFICPPNHNLNILLPNPGSLILKDTILLKSIALKVRTDIIFHFHKCPCHKTLKKTPTGFHKTTQHINKQLCLTVWLLPDCVCASDTSNPLCKHTKAKACLNPNHPQ